MAGKHYSINVTQEDLDLGEMRDSNRCAVKRAVMREIPGSSRVEVDVQTVRFTKDGQRHVFLTPWQIAEYIIAFDAGDSDNLAPFSFRLRAAVEVGSKVQRTVRTSTGRKVDSAQSKLRQAKARKAEAEVLLNDPLATPADIDRAQTVLDTADEKIAAAARNVEQVLQEVGGTPRQEVQDKDRPKPPRKVKTRTRRFGMRVMRVNQADGRTHVHN